MAKVNSISASFDTSYLVYCWLKLQFLLQKWVLKQPQIRVRILPWIWKQRIKMIICRIWFLLMFRGVVLQIFQVKKYSILSHCQTKQKRILGENFATGKTRSLNQSHYVKISRFLFFWYQWFSRLILGVNSHAINILFYLSALRLLKKCAFRFVGIIIIWIYQNDL